MELWVSVSAQQAKKHTVTPASFATFIARRMASAVRGKERPSEPVTTASADRISCSGSFSASMKQSAYSSIAACDVFMRKLLHGAKAWGWDHNCGQVQCKVWWKGALSTASSLRVRWQDGKPVTKCVSCCQFDCSVQALI